MQTIDTTSLAFINASKRLAEIEVKLMAANQRWLQAGSDGNRDDADYYLGRELALRQQRADATDEVQVARNAYRDALTSQN